MARYTFTCEHFDYNDWTGEETGVISKTVTEFRADEMITMLENFESFLRGAGFVFDGHIDVVEPEPESIGTNTSVWNRIVADHLTFLESKEVQGNCEVCNLPKSVMATNKCYDQNCPVQTNAN